MIAKSIGWTMSGLPGRRDPVESDINHLGTDDVLVRIDAREANRADLDRNSCGDDTTHADVCRGVHGRVMEAGANALWYVDRSVFIPAGSRCENCDAGQRNSAATRASEEITENHDDGTLAKFVVVRARELCVVSTNIDWQKPVST
jgi:D-arabinose 1-dehydrogenase-like Zn-dependent alcohol dehydrogenase